MTTDIMRSFRYQHTVESFSTTKQVSFNSLNVREEDSALYEMKIWRPFAGL